MLKDIKYQPPKSRAVKVMQQSLRESGLKIIMHSGLPQCFNPKLLSYVIKNTSGLLFPFFLPSEKDS